MLKDAVLSVMLMQFQDPLERKEVTFGNSTVSRREP
jgi:hypothetical protein